MNHKMHRRLTTGSLAYQQLKRPGDDQDAMCCGDLGIEPSLRWVPRKGCAKNTEAYPLVMSK